MKCEKKNSIRNEIKEGIKLYHKDKANKFAKELKEAENKSFFENWKEMDENSKIMFALFFMMVIGFVIYAIITIKSLNNICSLSGQASSKIWYCSFFN